MTEEKFVHVSDNWHGNYPGDMIRVRIAAREDCKDVIILAEGTADFAMYLRTEAYTEEARKVAYETWKTHIYDKIPDCVDQQWFLDHGFLID